MRRDAESWDCSAWRASGGARDLIDVCKHVVGGNEEEGARLFSVMPSDRTRGTGQKIKTHENTSEHIFSVRVVKHWKGFSERLWSLHL